MERKDGPYLDGFARWRGKLCVKPKGLQRSSVLSCQQIGHHEYTLEHTGRAHRTVPKVLIRSARKSRYGAYLLFPQHPRISVRLLFNVTIRSSNT